MKTLIAFGILLIACTTLQAASLKNLSEKLSVVSKTNENGEKVITDNTNKQLHRVDSRDEDESVAELDRLRNHHHDVDNEIIIESNESLEKSLRKLHDKNPHHLKSQNHHEVVPDAHTTPKQKEIIENLPQLESHEPPTSTVSSIKVGQSTLRMNKNDISLTPANILRHLNGKYSAYDMAQYVFWTGDEEGVAKAVEELIDNGLMSRENALEFLSDIRTGMEYLEGTYNFNSADSKDMKLDPVASTSSDDSPSSFSIKYQRFHSALIPRGGSKEKVMEDMDSPTLSPIAFKALEKLPSLLKLTESHKNTNSNRPENLEPFDEENERSRLADFLYGEYSLEEVIYQLAKTMFTQSLTTGSEESQIALQKLTEFLEKEGKHGRISASLQKKILDVLLAALSDTLNENPEIMEKVRHAIEKN